MMKNLIQTFSPLLLVAFLLISQYELPVHDFVKGLLLGLSMAGSLYTIAQYGRNRKSKTV